MRVLNKTFLFAVLAAATLCALAGSCSESPFTGASDAASSADARGSGDAKSVAFDAEAEPSDVGDEPPDSGDEVFSDGGGAADGGAADAGADAPDAAAIPPDAAIYMKCEITADGGIFSGAHYACKKGSAGEDQAVLALMPRRLGITWSYTWYPAEQMYNTHFEHVPMIWGWRDICKKETDGVTCATPLSADPATLSALKQMAGRHPGSHWLIFNEPDAPAGWGQANINPTDAAPLYHDTILPTIRGGDPTAKLIVGGTYWLDASAWLEPFRAAYFTKYNVNPDVDGFAVHHYVDITNYRVNVPASYPGDIADWRSGLTAIHNWMVQKGYQNKELWLTEFGCYQNCSDGTTAGAVAQAVMLDQVPWLDAQPWLTRYSWFSTGYDPRGNSGSHLLDINDTSVPPTAALTPFGWAYRPLP